MSDELDYGRMDTIYASTDKDVSLTFGVFKGNASVAMFKKGNPRPLWKLTIERTVSEYMVACLNKLLKGTPDTKYELVHQEWLPEEKKIRVIATMTFGRDKENAPYIGVTGPDIPPSKFPLKSGLKLDAGTSLDPIEVSNIKVKAMVKLLDVDLHQARLATSYKREFNGKGGGRSGGGGYNRNNNNSGGGNGGETPSRQSDIPDDNIPF